MKSASYTVFIFVVLSIHTIINMYILRRGWPATAWMGSFRYLVLMLFLFLFLAYPVGRFAERAFRGAITEWTIYAGSFWLAMMVYFLFLLLFIDLIRLSNHFLHFLPSAWTQFAPKTQKVTFFIVVSGVVAVTLAGYFNAIHPRVRTINLIIDKACYPLERLNLVVASDLHLGRNLCGGRLKKTVEMLNRLEPDLVLLPGDTLDEDVTALSDKEMAAAISKIHAPYGVFAVTGNHEYYRGLRDSVDYLTKANVAVLQDRAVKVAGALYVIGRKDRTADQFGEPRLSLTEVLRDVDPAYPLILMDHQPFHLEEAQQQGIDLQLSGHTHHGQLFPFNLITKRLYEVSWGYLSKGSTQYYVSCGAGAWGPPVRTGSVPEILLIKIKFDSLKPVGH
jgi:predicted MPP superfamily phosphohydrolase